MRKMTVILYLTVAVLLGSAGEVWSADFQKGINAYNKKDYAAALREFSPLAEQGDAESQHLLGYMHDEGLGIDQNFPLAEIWYRRAADQGHPASLTNLGWMYSNGVSVPVDFKMALKWFTLAAKQGYPIAQFKLGWMHSTGRGVPKDDKTALKWYRLAADQGEASARMEVKKLQKRFSAQALTPKVDKQQRLELVRRTQEALQVLGLYSGRPDGIIGAKTKSAIRQWRKRTGYFGTGELTETQLTKLE